MKEFKYCHEEITMGVEIPVTVCETQKEMVAELIMQKDCFDFAADRMNAVEEKRVKGYFNIGDGTLDQYAYREACNEAISGTDEEMMYIIYKDGSKYWNGAGEVEGKFKRYGIKRAIISAPWGYTVFGDFAINDMGDVTIEESEIEEYGVYAGQYDVKEQDEQEVQETVEQTETKTNETTVETTTEQETVEGISKAETATAESGTEVEQNVETAEQIQAYEQKTEFKKDVITMKNKKLFKDAGSKGVYIDKLREKYPFRICRTSESQFEAVLKGVQPLNDGDEIPIYRFPGGECCENPFDLGVTIIEW